MFQTKNWHHLKSIEIPSFKNIMLFKITKTSLILTGLHPAGEILESGELDALAPHAQPDHVDQPRLGQGGGLVRQKPTVPVPQNNT